MQDTRPQRVVEVVTQVFEELTGPSTKRKPCIVSFSYGEDAKGERGYALDFVFSRREVLFVETPFGHADAPEVIAPSSRQPDQLGLVRFHPPHFLGESGAQKLCACREPDLETLGPQCAVLVRVRFGALLEFDQENPERR